MSTTNFAILKVLQGARIFLWHLTSENIKKGMYHKCTKYIYSTQVKRSLAKVGKGNVMFVFVHGYDFLRAKVITLRYRIISKPTMNFTVHTLNFMAQAPTTELNLQLK